MKMVDADDSGKVTKRELVETFEKLAKLVNYDLTLTDLGELGYLWAVMDVNNEGELNFNEVEQILKNLALTSTIKDYGQQTMQSPITPEEKRKAAKKAEAPPPAVEVEAPVAPPAPVVPPAAEAEPAAEKGEV